MKNGILPALMALALACSPEAPLIEYGFDMCHYCKMSIVDKQHAAMAVTQKGKAYKFDAIECLIPFLEQQQDAAFAHVLVNDYDRPGTMIPAEKSHFLVSRAIPSPMGAFLSAFSSEKQVGAIQQEKGGEVYRWEEIKQYLRR
jgi:copper chaperone NosL